MPSIHTSDITRASDSTYFVDIVRVNKFILTYLTVCRMPSTVYTWHCIDTIHIIHIVNQSKALLALNVLTRHCILYTYADEKFQMVL